MSTTEPNPVAGFVLATLLALVVVTAVAWANGGLSALLTVGEDFPIKDYIVADLGDVQLASGAGHDGQQYYGIARDPLGIGQVPDLVDNPSYRYLHILYPALAGGFGLFSPDATVTAMVMLAVGGFGLAAAAAVRLAGLLGGLSVVGALAVVNIGLLLSVRFLLPDALALGLALLGVTYAVSGRDRFAGPMVALAVLAKPTYLVFPLALGMWTWRLNRHRFWWLAALPAVPAGMWAAYVFLRFGFSTGGNLGLPLAGLVGGADLWADRTMGDIALAGAAVAVLVVGAWLAVVTRDSMLRWLLAGWVGIGVLSSELVWEFGNNILRVVAPTWPLSAVAAAVYFSSSRSRRNLPV